MQSESCHNGNKGIYSDIRGEGTRCSPSMQMRLGLGGAFSSLPSSFPWGTICKLEGLVLAGGGFYFFVFLNGSL